MSEPNDLLDNLPRAPSQAAWDAMSAEERARVVEALPCYMTEAELSPPEGDPHSGPVRSARDALGGFFGAKGRSHYIGCDLIVYYPDRRRFAPDVFVVFDVEPHEREKWVVSHEGRGLDWVLEVLYSGDRKKDLERNVRLYAELGVPEYFVYDSRRQALHGFRLPEPGATAYVPVLAQYGRYPSEVLGLDLCVEEGRLRFYAATAPLLETPEIIDRLRRAAAGFDERLAEEARARAEAEQGRAEAEQGRAEEARARAEAERRLAELQARLDELEGRDPD